MQMFVSLRQLNKYHRWRKKSRYEEMTKESCSWQEHCPLVFNYDEITRERITPELALAPHTF